MASITDSSCESHAELLGLLNAILVDLTALRTAVNTNKTVAADVKTLANDLRNKILGDYIDNVGGLTVGTSAPAKVKHGAIEYHINGQGYNLAAGEETLSGSVVPDDMAGAWAIEVDAAGTVSIVAAPDNATGYDDAAAAVTALPAQTADKARLGTVAILNNGASFNPGTTQLSAATVTDTYVDATPLMTTLGAAVSTTPVDAAALTLTA